jgi:hypothetical protein
MQKVVNVISGLTCLFFLGCAIFFPGALLPEGAILAAVISPIVVQVCWWILRTAAYSARDFLKGKS